MKAISSLPARRFRFALTLVVTGLSFLLGAASPARAASEERKPFTNSLQKMPAAGASAAAVTGSADASEVVEFQVALRMRDFPKLLARLAAGERLTQAEMAARYYPLPADARAVAEWAAKQGLTVVDVEANNLGVHVRGTVAQVQTALHTTFARVTYEGAPYTAAQTAPSLPASIAASVLGINGLQPYLHAHKHHIELAAPHPSPQIGNQPPYYIKEILHAYDADTTGFTGANQKIAILIDTFPLDTDLTAFWKANGIPQSLANIEKVNVLNTTLPPPEGEETLDVSWSSGIAPAAHVRIYATSDLEFTNIDKALQRIVTELPAQPELKQLSLSLGLGELYISSSEVQTESQYFATIASFGVSIFVSTGDAGSMPDVTGHDPDAGPLQVEYESSDPSVTAVGGTSLFLDPSSGDVASEIAWSDTGGGASIFFTRPSYQTGAGVPAGTQRLVPDVALAADPDTGCFLVLDGEIKQFGGTSWSAPTWAGFSALINQARITNGLPSLGLLNTLIYPLIGTDNFRDIIKGSNGLPGSNLYNAGPGFDETTGIGVPDVNVLLQTLSGGGVTPTLAITSFTPTIGAPGTVVVLQGSQFNHVNEVSFNGVDAVFSVNSSAQITAVVPATASTGLIAVFDTSGNTAVSAQVFTVLAPAGVNDEFVNALPITTATAQVTASNVNATKEAGEPNHAGNIGGASVWYAFTAPATGVYSLNTFGSNFDTLLAVYTGATVSTLTTVASNDDANTGVASSLTFNATAGVVYHIAVDGFNGGTGPAEGNFVLNLAPSLSAPTITDFTPTSGSPGTPVVITGTGFVGTAAVTFNGTTAAFTINSNTQITAIVPVNATTGPIQVTDTASRSATSTEFFIVLSTPANDNFANAQPLSGTSAIAKGTNVGATKEPGEPDHAGNKGGASVWYVWTPTVSGVYTADTFGSSFDTLLAAYTGTAVDALTTVASDDDTGTGQTSSITFTAAAGTTYHFAVDGFNGDTGAITLNLGPTSSLPQIIAFVPPSAGAGVTVTITGTNFTGATAVTFAGTPATSFTVENSTRITAVVPNSAASGVKSGPITVVTPAGTATSLQNFTALTGPPNDNFANAQAITGTLPLVVTGTNGGATKEVGEPVILHDAGGRSVWYSYTAASNAAITITTRGSDFDTLLGVYTGGTVSTLTLVASNDDDPAGGETSAVTFNAAAGKTYRITVDGVNGDAGDITLSILPAGTSTTLYSTGFEASEGFVANAALDTGTNIPLVGQQGWTVRTGTGGNGVLLNPADNSQFAFVGHYPPPDGSGSTQIYHPMNFVPNATQGVVSFTTGLQILDSTNGFFDLFGFTVYNTDGRALFQLFFDNSSDGIFYGLDDGKGLVPTGNSFEDEVGYTLNLIIDLSNNVWTATLDGNTIVSGQPITTLGSARTLGDVDVTWNLTDPSNPGDNAMYFDNFSAIAVTAEAPLITVQPGSQTVTTGNNASFSVVAAGSQPLAYQWYFDGVPIQGATSPTYGVTDAQAVNAGAYSVMVSNSFGTVTSAAATLTVTPGPITPVTPAVSVVVREATASSSTGLKGLLVFTRTGDTTSPLTVNYKVTGSAQPGVDYKPLSGTVTFLPGNATVKLKIKAIKTALTGTGVTKVKVTELLGAGYTLGDPSKGKITVIHTK